LFLPCGRPCAEDASCLRPLGEEDKEQSILFGMADDDLPKFSNRVPLVIEDGS
jgi:hypothetical protein